MKYLAVLFLILQSACASKLLEKAIPQRAYNADEVRKVNKVAIIAFEVLQYVPTGIAGKIGGSAAATLQAGSNIKGQSNPLALEIYQKLVKDMSAERKWSVLPLDKVTENATYQELVVARAPTLHQQTNHFQTPYIVEGLARPANPEYMLTATERRQLAKALGVDALIIVSSQFRNEAHGLLGLGVGTVNLINKLAFYLYEASSDRLAWYDYGFNGPESEEPIGKVQGLEDATKISELSVPLADKTIALFLEHPDLN